MDKRSLASCRHPARRISNVYCSVVRLPAGAQHQCHSGHRHDARPTVFARGVWRAADDYSISRSASPTGPWPRAAAVTNRCPSQTPSRRVALRRIHDARSPKPSRSDFPFRDGQRPLETYDADGFKATGERAVVNGRRPARWFRRSAGDLVDG